MEIWEKWQERMSFNEKAPIPEFLRNQVGTEL